MHGSIADKTDESSPFNCNPLEAAPTNAAPTKRSKSRKPEPLPAEAVCKTCGLELAVFYQSRAWCIHCEQMELFGDITAHKERVAKIAREVGR